MLRRALELAAFAGATLLTSSAAAAPIRNFYNWIEKPWSAASLAEGAAIAVCCGALARTRNPRWAALAFFCCVGWGIVRVWLDPMFDPLIGVIMRRNEIGLGVRLMYQAALFGLVITPLAVSVVLSGRAGHFVQRRWRWLIAPGYLALVAFLVVTPEFMTLTVF